MAARAPATLTLLLGAALAAWIVTLPRMRGMDAGPGTDLGGLGWYEGLWVTMMAAMMLPSAAPMVLAFRTVSARRAARTGAPTVPTWVFVAGYLAAWALYGLLAYALIAAVRGLHPAFLAWEEGGPVAAGALVAAAGLYQLTPLKSACLRHCRSPMAFVLTGWRGGRLGALRMGSSTGSGASAAAGA